MSKLDVLTDHEGLILLAAREGNAYSTKWSLCPHCCHSRSG
ncbi:hypothetical protein [Phaeovulum vinaykumarii]|nr:hypothetical protein [Phaeovulum vinaykumarii]